MPEISEAAPTAQSPPSALEDLAEASRAPLLSPDDVSLLLTTPAKRDMLWRDVVRRIKLGLTTAQIAAEMGVVVETVRRWYSDPRFIVFARREDERIFGVLDAEIGDLKGKIDGAAQHAFEELCDILATSNDPKVRAQVAQDLLDRAGHGAVKKSVRAEIAFNISSDSARALADGFRESIEVEKQFGPTVVHNEHLLANGAKGPCTCPENGNGRDHDSGS